MHIKVETIQSTGNLEIPHGFLLCKKGSKVSTHNKSVCTATSPLDQKTSRWITGGGNSSYMQRLVKGDFRRVFHAAVGKRLVFFHVKVGTDILLFCLP